MTTYYCVVLIRPGKINKYCANKSINIEGGRTATLLGINSWDGKDDGYEVTPLSKRAHVLITEDLNFALHRACQYTDAYASPTNSYHVVEFEYEDG